MGLVSDNIVKFSLLFLGIKEVGNNEGWESIYFKKWKKTFLQLMQWVGWKRGQAWCSYFGELIWKLAYKEVDHFIFDEVDDLFSANCVQTWKNFRDSRFITSQVPKEGALAIFCLYKNGNPTTSGHLCVIITFDEKYYHTVDGNTGGDDKREGDEVGENTWSRNRRLKRNGLNLLGFVHPLQVDKYFI